MANFNGEDILSDWLTYTPPELEAQFYMDALYYLPGEPVDYRLLIRNTGTTFAYQVPVQTCLSMAKGQYIDGTVGLPFTGWTIHAQTDGSVNTDAGSFSDNNDLFTVVNIAADGFVDYTMTALVAQDMAGAIDVHAELYPLKHFDGMVSEKRVALSALGLPTFASEMQVSKEAVVNKKADGQTDESITYRLTATNAGKGNLMNVHLFDDLTKIQDKAGQPVFSGWTTEMRENGKLVESSRQPKPDENIDMRWHFKSGSRNRVEFVINAILSDVNLDLDIINLFMATDASSKTVEDRVTTSVKKTVGNPKDTLLKLNKRARQAQLQPGQAAEYEIIVDNLSGAPLANLVIEDNYPAGFRYIDGSAKLRYSTVEERGDFTSDVVGVVTGDKLVFTPRNIESVRWSQLRLGYVMTAGIGTAFGHYTNTASAKNEYGVISNTDSATVTVTGDKLFDTTAIIGKVFEDRAGNGYQSEATAKGLIIRVSLDDQAYIRGSTTLVYADEKTVLKDIKHPLITQGVVIKTLAGQSMQRLTTRNKVILRFKTRTDKVYPFTVTSKTGSHIVFDSKGQYKKYRTGHLKKGLSNEDLFITRNIYSKGSHYLWEIEIENIGINDEGIPGVQLITGEGFRVETDEFGRFHIPDRWVTDKKGRNFAIKVDTGTLPKGMRVISENPKVQRLTPNQLSRFNFSVQKVTLQK